MKRTATVLALAALVSPACSNNASTPRGRFLAAIKQGNLERAWQMTTIASDPKRQELAVTREHFLAAWRAHRLRSYSFGAGSRVTLKTDGATWTEALDIQGALVRPATDTLTILVKGGPLPAMFVDGVAVRPLKSTVKTGPPFSFAAGSSAFDHLYRVTMFGGPHEVSAPQGLASAAVKQFIGAVRPSFRINDSPTDLEIELKPGRRGRATAFSALSAYARACARRAECRVRGLVPLSELAARTGSISLYGADTPPEYMTNCLFVICSGPSMPRQGWAAIVKDDFRTAEGRKSEYGALVWIRPGRAALLKRFCTRSKGCASV